MCFFGRPKLVILIAALLAPFVEQLGPRTASVRSFVLCPFVPSVVPGAFCIEFCDSVRPTVAPATSQDQNRVTEKCNPTWKQFESV
jgi:hypothetical protein